MTKTISLEPPVWLSDHGEIRRLLANFLDKVDKHTRLLIRLTPKSVPSLFDYNNPDSRLIWHLIQMLEKDYSIITIELERAHVGKEDYDNAKIRFNLESEDLVRQWLDRPKQSAYVDQWRLAVESVPWSSSANLDYIGNNPLIFSDRPATDVAHKLAALESSLEKAKTLRHLSANYFWGDSKFLDNRKEYLLSAFPDLREKILARPLLVNIYIPDQYSTVLFIENQDTFLMVVNGLMDRKENRTAIVYTAGFRGAAHRIRDTGNYIFSTLSQTSVEALHNFTLWWENQCKEAAPSFFWGDLDYSGLGILAALRNTFEDITAWQPGYQVMLEHLYHGTAHTISSASKGAQVDPGNTNCSYADEVLLPAIRKGVLFVDQEIVDFPEIQEHFSMGDLRNRDII